VFFLDRIESVSRWEQISPRRFNYWTRLGYRKAIDEPPPGLAWGRIDTAAIVNL
jgi:hypothetical protein